MLFTAWKLKERNRDRDRDRKNLFTMTSGGFGIVLRSNYLEPT